MPTSLPAAPCPVCERPSTAGFTPFCSAGCRDRDLLQWLGEGYRLPGRPIDPMEEDDWRGGGVDRPGERD